MLPRFVPQCFKCLAVISLGDKSSAFPQILGFAAPQLVTEVGFLFLLTCLLPYSFCSPSYCNRGLAQTPGCASARDHATILCYLRDQVLSLLIVCSPLCTYILTTAWTRATQ